MLEYKDYVRDYVRYDSEAPALTKTVYGLKHGGGSDL